MVFNDYVLMVTIRKYKLIGDPDICINRCNKVFSIFNLFNYIIFDIHTDISKYFDKIYLSFYIYNF